MATEISTSSFPRVLLLFTITPPPPLKIACNHDTISSISAFAPPPQTPISDLFRHLDLIHRHSPSLTLIFIFFLEITAYFLIDPSPGKPDTTELFFISYCCCCSVGVGAGATKTFSVVLNMQIYIAFVATCVCVVGLFASGDWNGLKGEMQGFGKGQTSYVMTLVWTAIAWQICSVDVVGLIFMVSSLFSNVISTMALPIVPIFDVIFSHDKVDGIKIVALLMALWGLSCLVQSMCSPFSLLYRCCSLWVGSH